MLNLKKRTTLLADSEPEITFTRKFENLSVTDLYVSAIINTFVKVQIYVEIRSLLIIKRLQCERNANNCRELGSEPIRIIREREREVNPAASEWDLRTRFLVFILAWNARSTGLTNFE